ncbi:hypothetical protein HNY73_007371 [Argiope bruennichi]|uniref:Uncharacterized protein n=1 Tax=Argiope bruennichi TaxID=94029 RepID=A0A8T0FKS0_ARGBR|nr:hypothetical protein HNY73_007371 [Argiope bruennichi]
MERRFMYPTTQFPAKGFFRKQGGSNYDSLKSGMFTWLLAYWRAVLGPHAGTLLGPWDSRIKSSRDEQKILQETWLRRITAFEPVPSLSPPPTLGPADSPGPCRPSQLLPCLRFLKAACASDLLIMTCPIGDVTKLKDPACPKIDPSDHLPPPLMNPWNLHEQPCFQLNRSSGPDGVSVRTLNADPIRVLGQGLLRLPLLRWCLASYYSIPRTIFIPKKQRLAAALPISDLSPFASVLFDIHKSWLLVFCPAQVIPALAYLSLASPQEGFASGGPPAWNDPSSKTPVDAQL